MNLSKLSPIILIFALLLLGRDARLAEGEQPNPAAAHWLDADDENRATSPGNTTYFIDPARGGDAHAGTQRESPWKSFAPLNSLKLAPGDRVVIAPGRHEESLAPAGEGSAEAPVVIQFLPGVHEFGVEKAIRLPMFVSNACDAPHTPKLIGILVQNFKHLRLHGGGVEGAGKTTILYAGRMVEIFNDRSEDISYSRLAFDLKRPTVSEFRVMEHTSPKGTLFVTILCLGISLNDVSARVCQFRVLFGDPPPKAALLEQTAQ